MKLIKLNIQQAICNSQFVICNFIYIFCILLFLFCVLFLGCNSKDKKINNNENSTQQVNGFVRSASNAGKFYPENKESLSSTINAFLAKVKLKNEMGSLPFAMVVPHAGYEFSGQVASYAYSLIKDKNISTVILIGRSHNGIYKGISLQTNGYYKTPLGKVKINETLAKNLSKKITFTNYYKNYDLPEHSLEVQIPFLQLSLKNFQIIPILIGEDSLQVATNLAKAIYELLQENPQEKFLIVISTDMSHYSKYDDAVMADKTMIEAFLSGSANKVIKTSQDLMSMKIPNLLTNFCGMTAVLTLLQLLDIYNQQKIKSEIKLLKYANSGEVLNKQKDRVVGYMAAAIFLENKNNNDQSKSLSLQQEKFLNNIEQQKLLKLARQTLENYIIKGKFNLKNFTDKNLQKNYGAFVTLKKNGELRGCIGNIVSQDAIYKTVQHMTIASATKDTRFSPVTEDELKNIKIEISVLSVPKKNSWDRVVLGRDGVIVEGAGTSGVFLPQVAVEQKWNKEEFLSNLCVQKAGLPPDCYKMKNVQLYTFTAQVFEEKD